MGTTQDLYLQRHTGSDLNRDAELPALLRAKAIKEDRKPARPPVEEPNQEPAIEDPLPEESRDEAVPGSRH